MGQYYKAWLKERETEIVFEDNDGNLKLLEHAYFGSDMTEAVMRRLYMRMHRVVWCGDYAKEEECQALGFQRSTLFEDNDKHITVNHYKLPTFCRFIINHSKHEYIDFFKYLTNAGQYLDGYDWIIHPLPILTALGNGRGSGDYDGDNLPNVDKAGRWAGDFISCENTLPGMFYNPDGTTGNYTELDVVFTENYTEQE